MMKILIPLIVLGFISCTSDKEVILKDPVYFKPNLNLDNYNEIKPKNQKVYNDLFNEKWRPISKTLGHYRLVGPFFYKEKDSDHVIGYVFIGFAGRYEVHIDSNPPKIKECYFISKELSKPYKTFDEFFKAKYD